MKQLQKTGIKLLAAGAAVFGIIVACWSFLVPTMIGRAPLGATLIFFSGFVLLSGLLFLLSQKASDRTLRLLFLFCFLTLAALALCYVIQSPLAPKDDLSHIIKQAKDMIRKNTHYITDRKYFGFYPRNIPCAVIIYWIYRFAVGIRGRLADAGTVSGIINVIFILLSIIMLCRTVYCMTTNHKAAFLAKMLLLFNPAWLAFAGYYYTDTLSLPFLTGGFLVFCKAVRGEGKKKYAGFLVSSFLFCVAARIRVTALILMIAILLILFTGQKWKDFAGVLASFLCMYIIVLCLGCSIERYHVDFSTYDSAVPVTHYIMMGSHGKGSYNQEDVNFTKSFPTHEEKVRRTAARALQNIKSNGILGNVIQMAKKTAVMFGEGTFGYYQFTRYAESESPIHEWIAGKQSGLFQGMMQGYRILWLLLAAAGGAFVLKRKSSPLISIILLYFLGTVLFTMIWELHPRHACTYVPMITLLVVPFFEYVTEETGTSSRGF